MTFGSLCSGIESASVAWCGAPLNWTCRFVAEIEPYCCALLKQHYPDVPNLGDILKIDGKALRGSVDVLIAGTPCQAFSVAGKRKSLADARGNLTLKFVELVHDIKPRFTVYENVPGILSTDDNAFGCFLAGLVGADETLIPEPDTHRSKRWRTTRKAIHKRRNKKTGEWQVLKWKEKRVCSWPSAGVVDGPRGSLCWRILDAQYQNLAQRRERVFLIFCPPDGIHPADVLLEWESSRRDYPPSREERQRTPPAAEGRSGSSGANSFSTSGGLVESDVSGTLSARNTAGGGLGTDFELGGGIAGYDVVPALTSSGRGVERCGESRGQDPVVVVAR